MNIDNIQIRRISSADAARFDDIAPEVFDEPVVPERLAAYLADPQNLMILAMDGEVAVGQCAGVIHRHPDKPTELYVDEVGVSPDWQRRGIARAMLVELFAWGRELGCEEAWVGTELDNVPARKLYDGFDGEPPETFVLYLYDLDDL